MPQSFSAPAHKSLYHSQSDGNSYPSASIPSSPSIRYVRKVWTIILSPWVPYPSHFFLQQYLPSLLVFIPSSIDSTQSHLYNRARTKTYSSRVRLSSSLSWNSWELTCYFTGVSVVMAELSVHLSPPNPTTALSLFLAKRIFTIFACWSYDSTQVWFIYMLAHPQETEVRHHPKQRRYWYGRL